MQNATFELEIDFELESGDTIKGLTIAYHTYGHLNAAKNNVVWICHALTANSNAKDWWGSLCEENRFLNHSDYYFVCPNILGSCYGTTGPLSINPITNQPYYSTFPSITIRDMVKAHQALAKHLGVDTIKILMGGSMGGYQALEWATEEPNRIQKMILLCTGARESAWGIAIHTAQRMAIEADPTWKDHSANAGRNGLMAARAIGMLTYRNYEQFVLQQTEDDVNKTDDFKASSYMHYQGEKLANRFHAYAYWVLTKAMDSHNVGRNRGGIDLALARIQAKTLLIGISTDQLCPPQEQAQLAELIPSCQYHVIASEMGHDGFLTEGEKIDQAIQLFLQQQSN